MTTTFSSKYKEMFPWCDADAGDKKSARCVWCDKSFRIDTMGKMAFSSHEKGKKHQQELKTRRTNVTLNAFAVGTSSKLPVTDHKENSVEPLPLVVGGKHDNVTPSTSGVMAKYILNDKVTSAEIVWSLATVMTHNSYRGAGDQVELFRLMFPDSDVASKLELGRTKISYLITHGLAPYFSDNLLKKMGDSTDIVIGFDETLNKISQRQQLDVGVRFWCEETQSVVSRYVGSVFLSSTRAKDILKGLKDCFSANPSLIGKTIQISMDGPNVNLSLQHELNEELKELRGPNFSLLNIGSCGLHVVHNAFKNGMKKTDWCIEDFLYAVYNLFKNVPLRRADFTAVTGSSVFPLKFCAVRWVENQSVAKRANEMFPFLKKYVRAVKNQNDKKLKESNIDYMRSFTTVVKSKAFETVATAINDPFFEAKLSFFITAAASVEPFLRGFQSESPMAPFLYDDLTDLLRLTMEKALKPEAIKAKSKALIEVSLDDTNFLSSAKIDIGFATKAALTSLEKKAKEKISEQKFLLFRNDCKSFYKGFIAKMVERSPLGYPLTRYMSCLNPQILNGSPDVCTKRLDLCLEHFVAKNHLSGTVADKVKQEFSSLVKLPTTKAAASSFKRQHTRLDEFWMTVVRSSATELPNLVNFLKKLLILSHGNATLERGFSVNKECLVVNQLEVSLVAQRIVYDAVIKEGGVKKVIINKSMIHYARNAHGRYKEFKEHQKAENTEIEKERKRKLEAARLTKELEAKKARLLADAQREAALIDERLKNIVN